MKRLLGVVGALALAAGMLVGGAVPAGASDGFRVVHPGQSIQAAIDAVGSGGTVLVTRGTYAQQVVITKRVRLVGLGVVLVPPAMSGPASPCSAPGPNTDGICVAGVFTADPNTGAVTVSSYVHDVTIVGFTIRGFADTGILQIGGSGSTFVGNRATGNGAYGIAAFNSTRTTELFNSVSGSGEAGFYIGDSPNANATLASNTSVNNMFGFFVRDAQHGRILANNAHDNCLGVLFLADAPGPDGAFNVAGNLIRHNDKACPGNPDTRSGPLSGIGLAISGAHDVSVSDNAILDNNPGGQTAHTAGVAVITGMNGAGTPPRNNRIQDNVIEHNSTDILWDGHGIGNVLQPNRCETSSPAGLCNPAPDRPRGEPDHPAAAAVVQHAPAPTATIAPSSTNPAHVASTLSTTAPEPANPPVPARTKPSISPPPQTAGPGTSGPTRHTLPALTQPTANR